MTPNEQLLDDLRARERKLEHDLRALEADAERLRGWLGRIRHEITRIEGDEG